MMMTMVIMPRQDQLSIKNPTCPCQLKSLTQQPEQPECRVVGWGQQQTQMRCKEFERRFGIKVPDGRNLGLVVAPHRVAVAASWPSEERAYIDMIYTHFRDCLRFYF